MSTSPLGWIITPFRRVTDWRGRSRRAEYWWFMPLWVLAVVAGAVESGVSPGDTARPFDSPILLLATIILLPPHLGVSIRRLHDQNLSGWYFLVSLIPFAGPLMMLWWMTRPGTAGDNRFGPDPLPPAYNPTKYYG
jgi:uncharacterized membrane protein YhaH (DUF805 family)